MAIEGPEILVCTQFDINHAKFLIKQMQDLQVRLTSIQKLTDIKETIQAQERTLSMVVIPYKSNMDVHGDELSEQLADQINQYKKKDDKSELLVTFMGPEDDVQPPPEAVEVCKKYDIEYLTISTTNPDPQVFNNIVKKATPPTPTSDFVDQFKSFKESYLSVKSECMTEKPDLSEKEQPQPDM